MSIRTLAVLLVCTFVLPLSPPVQAQSPSCRDPFLWPYTQNSIWNMPIGSGAQFVNANFKLPSNGYGAEENVIVLTPNAPLRAIAAMVGEGWEGGSQQPRCNSSGQNMYGGRQFPIPNDFVTLNRLGGGTPNASAAILDRDGETVYHNQPFTICSAGGTVLSKHPYGENNIKTGDGIRGAQGGSGMSSLGGAIRIHEMVSGGTIRHALKLVIYGAENIYFDNGAGRGYRWPAWKHDTGAECNSGSSNRYCGTNQALMMGALLALPQSVDINSLGLTTETGRMIARAMQDYGGYVVDNSAWSHVAVAVEFGPAGVGRTKWDQMGGFNRSDMDKIFSRLSVVNNNAATSIGGGGTPRVAVAPPFCAAGVTPGATITNPPPTNTTSPTCPKKTQGDANCDNNITVADYNRWRQEYLGQLTTKTADFNGSTTVTVADYNIWRKNYLAQPNLPAQIKGH